MTKNQVVKFYGSQSEVARVLKISRQSVHRWGRVPSLRQVVIEYATKGGLTCDSLAEQYKRYLKGAK